MHPQLVVGKRFPDLELPDHSGKSVRLTGFYRGYW